ncbi:NIPSNAP family protein [Marinimicrobium sp. ABcell2]|uniref:NIPSNAP family protein n=1 Tax=Marinimicrobium sp. ABcell2 TaxID=3069751 RepID=UPI0027B3F022|nr:NIPSNAP family protein [Marinimicrobium sp. ABcell2]MDQ2077137.1 NIPSNAP family protein [Marinimicrobium sp. ABcell2]
MKISALTQTLSVCLLFSLAVIAQADSATVFELRTYTTHEGKLPALNERFTNHTAGLFEKHGMRNVGYWVPSDPDKSGNTLIYILEHKSREAAAQSWQAFIDDPDWQKAYKESREDGPIVKHIDSVFMTATEYSAIR